jgi:hypothetical protein
MKLLQPNKKLLILILWISGTVLNLVAANKPQQIYDRVYIQGGSRIIFPDSTVDVPRDTLISIPTNLKYHIEKSGVKNPPLYDSLNARMRSHVLTRLLSQAIFVSPGQNGESAGKFVSPERPYLPYQGKSIVAIRLKKVPVHGGSVIDTLLTAETDLTRFLNRLHEPTRDGVIRHNLLFQAGDTVNANQLADNERILRGLPFIEDARIYLKPAYDVQDGVVVIVVTKDLFPIGFNPIFTDIKKYRFELYDRNVAGLGMGLAYTFYYDRRKTPSTGNEMDYSVNNIYGTFVNGLLQFNYAYGEKMNRLYFDRQFLTPRTRVAGALDLGQVSQIRLENYSGEQVRSPYTYRYGDFWVGRSFQVDGENSRKNRILAIRYRHNDFTERPFVSADSNYFYHNYELVLGSLIFRKSNYYKSSLILAFGVTEDVPFGYVYKLTYGIKREEFINKPYVGLEFGRAYRQDFIGYIGYGGSIGSFYYHDKWREGTLKLYSTYVAPLLRYGQFRFRQIVNLNMTFGINRLKDDFIDVKNDIRGISDFNLTGRNKISLSLESVAFSPWNPAGFRFAFFTYADMGFLSFDRKFRRDDFQGSLGIGCRIRNESLVFNTLVLRFGYFIFTPDGSNHWQIDVSTSKPTLFNNTNTLRPEIIPFD